MLSKLVKECSAPQVDLEPFDENPLEYIYFMSMFKESVEQKIEDTKGRLVRLIQYTREDAKDLIKNFINDNQNMGTITLWQLSIGSRETHTIYCHHIEEM